MQALGPWLGRLAVAVSRRRWAVLLAALGVGGAAGVLAFPVRVDPDLAGLLPEGDPIAAAWRGVLAEGGVGGLTLEVHGDAEGSARLAERLRAVAGTGPVRDGLPADLAAHAAAMSLPSSEVRSLTRRLRAARALGPAANPVLVATVLAGPVPTPTLPRLPFGEGRWLLRPARPVVDAGSAGRWVAGLREVLASPPPGVAVGALAGPAVVIADGAEAVRRDLATTGVASLVVVSLVLVVSLRGLLRPARLVVPLVPAVAVSLAAVQAWWGAIDPYTSIGAALLLGFGADHGLHLEQAFRSATGDHERRLATAWSERGPTCVVAAASSAAAFLPLAVCRFRGLSHLGLTLALGVGVGLVAQLLLLPALLPRGAPTPAAPEDPPTTGERRRWAGPAVVAVAALALAAAAFCAPRLGIQHDFTALSADDQVYSTADAPTRARLRAGLPPVVVRLRDGEPTAAAHAELEAARVAGRLPHVTAVLSTANLLPADQPERVQALRELVHEADAPGLPPLPPALARGLAELRAHPPRVRTEADLPPDLADWLGHGRRVLLTVDGDLFDVRESGALLDELRAVTDRELASEQLVQASMFRAVVADLPRAAVLALLGLGCWVVAELRGRSPLVLPALGVGLASLPVGWWLAGVELDLANLVGVPILIGLVDDEVLHVAEAALRTGSLRSALRQTRGPTATAALTTLGSFLVLLAADSRGLRSLGQLVVVGLVSSGVSAGLTLVLTWLAGWGRPAHRPR